MESFHYFLFFIFWAGNRKKRLIGEKNFFDHRECVLKSFLIRRKMKLLGCLFYQV